MTNKLRTIALVAMLAFVLVGFASSAEPACKESAIVIPAGIDLKAYPLFLGPLSMADQAQFNLRPKIFFEPSVGFNHNRSVDRFVWDNFPSLTVFLVDANGKPIYRACCGNRVGGVVFLELTRPIPTPVITPTPMPTPTVSPTPKELPVPSAPGWFGRRGKAMDSFLRWFLEKFVQ